MICFKKSSIWLMAISLLIFVQAAFACQRISGEVPFCCTYQATQTVFIGEVVKSEPHIVVPDNPNLRPEFRVAWTGKYNRLTFAVTETFKWRDDG